MALSPREAAELPCGRPFGPLVEQVAERRPPADPGHQAGCRYCQTALAELDALWSDVGRLARRRVEVPPGLLAATMRRVARRRERPPAPRPPDTAGGPRAAPRHAPRPGRHALLPSPRGATRIADGVIAAVSGRAALAVAGVRSVAGPAGAPRLRSPGSSAPEVRVDGATVGLALELTVALGPSLPALIAAVRAEVTAGVELLTGLAVTAVDVAIVDVGE